MFFGVTAYLTDEGPDLVELARAAEDRGFESFWVPEHTHIPVSCRTPWPSGGDIPREYTRLLDPFVALSAVVGATTSLRVGTGVCLVIERDTITLAKVIASLDHISNGRVLFGIGAGWNHEEMENHGTDPKTRWRKLREQVQAMKEIWTKDEAEYHGELVNFEPIWSWPKPVQKPHPPIIFGGDGPSAIRRAAEYADGWIPHPSREGPPLAERMAELNRLAAERGRGPLPVTIYGAAPDANTVEGWQRDGVERVVFRLPAASHSETMARLDACAAVVRSFR